MSIQLILHPQNYEGQFNSISSSPSEVLVNGISFANLDNSTSYDSPDTVNIPLDVLTNVPPVIVNTWYRYRSIGNGTPNLPVVLAGDLVLNSTTTQTLSGVYQKLSNLTIGSQYTFTIDVSTPASNGYIVLSAFNGTTMLTQTLFAATLSQITHTFTAASTEDTIMISYSNNASNEVTISNASIQPVIGAIPSGDTHILDNGQVIVDLYEDEDLPLTLSVDDFKNVAEQVQSYSKAFNLPATKRNNQIFNQIFDVTRSNDGTIFNPYKKTQCVLKQDGFILFEGYLRLLDVSDKLGETSYNVNLYSEVVALADFLKDRTFRDLDFTELTHDYNYSNIRNTWVNNNIFTNPSTSGFRSTTTVKYPFVDWNHQYGFTGGNMPKLSNLETAFRPFINIRYIIDRIFEGSPFTFTSGFFNSVDFNKLYMDFNWGADNVPSNIAGSTYVGQAPYSADIFLLPFATSSFSNLQLSNQQNNWNVTPPNYNQSTNILTATQLNETYTVNYDYYCSAATGDTVDFQWVHANSSGVPYPSIDALTITSTAPNLFYYTGSFNVVMQTGDTLQAQFKTNGVATFQLSNFASTVIFIQSISAVTSESFLQTLRGETGQWDFLKGLLTMFNLVSLPDEDNPNNIKIEPYSEVFVNSTDSVQHDWTEKIDVSEMKLTPLADLNKRTIFKFVEDDDDYAFTQYKNQVGGHLYGSKKYNAGNEFNILEGLDEVIAEPFAATLVKPLMDNFPEFITPAIYTRNADDGTTEGFDNSPRIMYDNGKKILSGTTYSVPTQNGVAGDAFENEFLQFSHLSSIPTTTSVPPNSNDTLDFHFGECQLMTGVGNATTNNLFNLYWLPYYNELYNPDTRIMTIKVNLTPADINTFKFNDKIFIKNRVFRVNRIDYKPNDLATVEFILIP